MKYYDYKNKNYYDVKESKSLKFLYNTILGRIVLKILVCRFTSKIASIYFNSFLSKPMIKNFIKKNNIDMSDYEKIKYKSFNDFFTRNIISNKRKIDNGLIAICDAKLSVYEINKNSVFNIKNSSYTISELLKEDSHNFDNGYALIYRLTPDDYHHYIFPDKGKVLKNKKIRGTLHTVQKIAFKKNRVFSENSREVTFLECDKYGSVAYIEVGAMLIGKITNKDIKTFNKGDEKGYFEFGGSTIILLYEKDKIKINKKILENTKNDIETVVKMGQNLE